MGALEILLIIIIIIIILGSNVTPLGEMVQLYGGLCNLWTELYKEVKDSGWFNLKGSFLKVQSAL